jgi:hypothetical protein
MRPVRDQSKVLKELAGVAERLASPKLSTEKRLALLRKQAELGDVRDEALHKARRAAH